MRTRIAFLFLLILLQKTSLAQNVQLASLQHNVRWVPEANFPNFTDTPDIRDSLLSATSEALKQHFKVQQTRMPANVDYRYYKVFGKPTIKKPGNASSPNDYNVSVLSLITRATVGYAVFWKMEIIAQQNGQTVFSKSTEHELEYYNVLGYTSSRAWTTDFEFAQLYADLINELLENSEPLPSKIIIGSGIQKQEAAKSLLPNASQCMLKLNGNFLEGGNFIMSLESGSDTLTTLRYMDGGDLSLTPLINMSEITANIIKSVTGMTVGYDARVKQKRFGRIMYNDGRIKRLRMQWLEKIQTSTSGAVESHTLNSPMVTEAYEDKSLVGSFTFINDHVVEKVDELYTSGSVFTLHGSIDTIPIQATYNSATEILEISRNGKKELVVLLENVNPNSRSFSGTKLSKNKVFISGSSQGIFKPKLKNPEWYHVYYNPSLSPQQLQQDLEAIAYLFFGMGNQF